jgi:Rrf2 family protein
MKKISSRFSVAVHILLLVDRIPMLTSEEIAGSVNTNPVFIRKIQAKLKKAGLIDVQPGVGGAYLLKDPDEITLLDVYRAVEVVEKNELFQFHEHPNMNCEVGANVESIFRSHVRKAQIAMENELARTTLKELAEELGEKISANQS